MSPQSSTRMSQKFDNAKFTGENRDETSFAQHIENNNIDLLETLIEAFLFEPGIIAEEIEGLHERKNQDESNLNNEGESDSDDEGSNIRDNDCDREMYNNDNSKNHCNDNKQSLTIE